MPTEPRRTQPSIPRPTAVVTGASSGLGRCLARALAQRGWATVVIARRAGRLEALADELAPMAPCTPLAMDLSQSEGVGPRLLSFLEDKGIEPDALFNNAGFGFFGEFLSQPMDLHERLWRVNYLAAVETTRALLPGMLARRRGHVMNTCSICSKIGPWGHAGYAASKAALVSVTQSLAAEFPARSSGVRFSFVNPGIVSTDYFENDSYRRMWPRVKHRAIAPEVVARKIVGLLDRPRLQLCVPWYYRFIDFIDALSPTLAHRIVAAESRPAD